MHELILALHIALKQTAAIVWMSCEMKNVWVTLGTKDVKLSWITIFQWA